MTDYVADVLGHNLLVVLRLQYAVLKPVYMIDYVADVLGHKLGDAGQHSRHSVHQGKLKFWCLIQTYKQTVVCKVTLHNVNNQITF